MTGIKYITFDVVYVDGKQIANLGGLKLQKAAATSLLLVGQNLTMLTGKTKELHPYFVVWNVDVITKTIRCIVFMAQKESKCVTNGLKIQSLLKSGR